MIGPAIGRGAPALDLENRLADPDAVFRRLIEVHRGLDGAASADLNARIVLLLANQLGDDRLVMAAFDMARAQLNADKLGAAR
jgi:hypothetical protein